MTTVSCADCREMLLKRPGDYGAKGTLASWRTRKGFEEVVGFVEGFTHKHLYEISSDDVRRVISESTHALGDIKSTEQLKIVENFTTPFAFQHIFHWYLESQRRVPSWREFRDWVVDGEPAEHWYLRMKKCLENTYPKATLHDRKLWSRAARWRLGKVYLSNIRELELFARLRECGLPVRYHLLADVLFRVDFWVDNHLICTYFPNSGYRDGAAGRKPPAVSFFAGAVPSYEIVDMPIVRQGFGSVWLASDDTVNALVKRLSAK